MKRIWILIGGVFLGGSPASSVETDKGAARDASSEADKWAASVKTEKATAPEATPTPSTQAKPAAPDPVVSPATPAVTPPVEASSASPALSAVKRVGLNEMKGKLVSKSYDPKAIRLIVSGSFNVEFTYDQKTVMINGGKSISIDDLSYNDEVVVRYAGKDLHALEIDRISKAPRPE
jgi:hypothetical protein